MRTSSPVPSPQPVQILNGLTEYKYVPGKKETDAFGVKSRLVVSSSGPAPGPALHTLHFFPHSTPTLDAASPSMPLPEFELLLQFTQAPGPFPQVLSVLKTATNLAVLVAGDARACASLDDLPEPLSNPSVKRGLKALLSGLHTMHAANVYAVAIAPEYVQLHTCGSWSFRRVPVAHSSPSGEVACAQRGSVALMSPEAFAGGCIDGQKNDVWAVAATVVAAVTGSKAAIRTVPLPRLKRTLDAAGMHANVTELLLSMLARRASDRPSVAALLSRAALLETPP